MKKYLWMLSVAVVIDALRVKKDCSLHHWPSVTDPYDVASS